jgi:hypothetical protein
MSASNEFFALVKKTPPLYLSFSFIPNMIALHATKLL